MIPDVFVAKKCMYLTYHVRYVWSKLWCWVVYGLNYGADWLRIGFGLVLELVRNSSQEALGNFALEHCHGRSMLINSEVKHGYFIIVSLGHNELW